MKFEMHVMLQIILYKGRLKRRCSHIFFFFFTKASDPPLNFLNLYGIFFTALSFLAHWHLVGFDCLTENENNLKLLVQADITRFVEITYLSETHFFPVHKNIWY